MKISRRTRPLPIRTTTLHGVPAPRPPALADETLVDLVPACADTDDTIVVDVEVNAAGQIVITGAERVP